MNLGFIAFTLTWIFNVGSYLAPEFLMHGIVDEKTDVFAFGVLLLELISGRRALDYSQQSLVMWVCFIPFSSPTPSSSLTKYITCTDNYVGTKIDFVYDRQSLCWKRMTSESLLILHFLMTTTPCRWTLWFYRLFCVCSSHQSGVLKWVRHVLLLAKILIICICPNEPCWMKISTG